MLNLRGSVARMKQARDFIIEDSAQLRWIKFALAANVHLFV